MPDTGTYLDDLPEQYQPKPPPVWDEVAKDFQEQFPHLDPKVMQQHYEHASKMAVARRSIPQGEEDTLSYLGRRSVPFLSTVVDVGLTREYGLAKQRMAKGEPTDDDYRTVALHEHEQARDEAASKTWGGALGSAAAHLPALAGEFAASGSALKAIGLGGSAAAGTAVAAPRFLSTEGLKAAGKVALKETLTPGGLARTAAQTALVPSMYADHWTKANLAAGREVLDVRGLPGAYALGVAQMTVLKGIGGLTSPAFPNSGLAQAAGRVGSQAASGPIAQAAADVLTSAVGLDTGYGTIGQLARGDTEGALRNATVQAFTFAAFGLAHEMGGTKRPPGAPDPVLAEYQQALQQLARRGVTKDDAGKALLQPADILSALLERNPNPSRAEVAAAMSTLPEGPARDWGMAIAKTIPVQPPAVPTPPPEKPPEAPPKGRKTLSEAGVEEIFGPALRGETEPPPAKPPTAPPAETPEGKREWFGRAPDQSGPPAPVPGSGGIINPVETGVPGIRSGAVEIPLEKPGPRVETAPPIPERIEPRTWTPEEIARLEKASPADLEAAADALLKESGYQHSDLDIPVDLDRAIDEGRLPANDAKALKTLLATSSTREAGRRLGVSHEAVRKRAARALTRLRDADPDRWEGIETAEDLVERGRQQQEQFLKEHQAAGALETMPSDKARSEIGKMMREIREMDDPALVEKELAAAHEELRDAIADSRRGPVEPAPVRPEDTARVQGPNAGRGAPVEAPRPPVQEQRAAENGPAPGKAPEAARDVLNRLGQMVGQRVRYYRHGSLADGTVEAVIDPSTDPGIARMIQAGFKLLPDAMEPTLQVRTNAGLDRVKIGDLIDKPPEAAYEVAAGDLFGGKAESAAPKELFGAEAYLPKGKDYWRAEALKAGVDPEEVFTKAGEIMATENQKTGAWNAALTEARSQLGNLGKVIHFEQYRDWTHLPRFDEVSDSIEKHWPMLAKPGEKFADTLFQMLKQGKRWSIERNEAHQQALDYLTEYKNATQEALRRGESKQAAEETLRAGWEDAARGDESAEREPSIDDSDEIYIPDEVAPGVHFFRGPGQRRGGQPGGPVPGGGGGEPRPGLIDDVKKLLAPAARGEEAAVGAGVMRANLAEMARSQEIARAALQEGVRHFDARMAGIDPVERTARFLEFTDAIESGQVAGLPEPLRQIAQTIRDLNDAREKQVLDRDLIGNTIENYLGHLWKKPGSQLAPEEIGRILAAKRPLSGKEGYRKQRTLPTYRDGIEAGLEPVDWNPVRLALMKMQEVDKSIMGHDVVAELKDQGMWEFVRLGGKVPEGWAKLNDKASTVFAPPEAKVREYFDKKQMEGLESFAKSLGIDIKTAMTGSPGRSDPQGVVRRFGTPEEILAHEIGHQIADRYGMNQWVADPAIEKEMKALGDLRASGQVSPQYRDYLRSGPEAAANLIAARLHAPELLQQVAPKAAARLETLLSRPELQGLRDIKPSLELGQRDQMMRLAGPMLTGNYWTPEPVARLLENYLQPGLRGHRVYDAVREFGNVLNSFQLGFSAFHAGFVAMDTQVSAAALGLQQISRGDVGRGMRSIAGLAVAPFRAWVQGSKVLSEYYKPGSQGAETAAIVGHLIQAGGRAKMDSFYGGDHIEAFRMALTEVRAGETAKTGSLLYHALPALAEAVSKPIMEMLVPRMKLGVFADLARYEMEKLPPGADPNTRRAVLGKAWDSVENRLGQVTYDNLFWNKTFKDMAMAGVRSVGWNLGTLRELGGGLKDVPAGIRGARAGEGIGPRLAYVVALPMVAGVYGALYQYLATGSGPEETRDYFFPKTGRTRRDGTADRVSLPSYMRDVAALTNRADEGPVRWVGNAGTMAKHKLHPAIGMVAEMISNEDYYGTAIVNPSDPVIRQSLDTAAHMAKAFTPFAARGYQQQKDTGAGTGQAAQSFVGITPAPAYVTRTSEQQREMEARRKIQLTPLAKKRKADAAK